MTQPQLHPKLLIRTQGNKWSHNLVSNLQVLNLRGMGTGKEKENALIFE